MAPSPCVDALTRTQRNGTPVNVLFVGSSFKTRIPVVHSLAGKELLRFCENDASTASTREFLVGRASSSKVFFTNANTQTEFEPLKRHLLSRRPANVIVYVRHANVDPSEESVFLTKLEASLGMALWQNAVCITVVDPDMEVSSDNSIPLALVRPGYQPTSCFWDGSVESTDQLAVLIADVATNTLPFLPQPQDSKDASGAVEGEFSELDLFSSNILSLTNLSESETPSAPACKVEAVSVDLPPSDSPTTFKGPLQLQQEQVPLVPAFASLSMAFAPAVPLHGPSLIQRRTAPKQSPPHTMPVPAALRGLPAVCAPVIGGGLSKGSLVMPGASLQLDLAPLKKKTPPTSVTAFPDVLRLPRREPTFRFPNGAAAGSRVVMMWLRNDLRVHDHEALAAANKDGVSVLPVYCFDPRDYGKSSSGFDRTGPFRARFLLQCVADLRRTLRERGSDLVVRVGRPESELVKLAKAVGANAMYSHQEVTREDSAVESQVSAALKNEGVETKYFWGSTLYHVEDLPFSLDKMPCNYGGFREALKSIQVRPTAETPKRMKQLPAKGNLNPGEIPTLAQLGLTPPSGAADIKEPALVGGESEALKRLSGFLAEAMAMQPLPPAKAGASTPDATQSRSTSIGPHMLGASFSCKISPWLAMGCLSPRRMFEEMKAVLPGTTSSGVSEGGSGGLGVSLDWLVFELLWRDFFRFITKKHSSARKDSEVAPEAVPV